MFKVKNLLKDIFSSIKHIPKKAYTNGLIVLTGCMMVTVLYLGVNGFFGSHTNVVAALEENTEEETDVSDVKSIEEEEAYLALNIGTAQLTDSLSDILSVEETEEIKEEVLESEENILKPMKEPLDNSDERQLRTASYKPEEPKDQLVNISAKDYEALTRIVEAEATGQDLTGKILIVNVVMNRVKSSKFPNDIYGVIHQSNNGKVQFSPISDGRYYSVTVTDSTKKAVESAFDGEDYSNGALYFAARSLASQKAMSWFDSHLTKVYEYGGHEFFK
ncbi:hypothetical protein SH1V18_35410 [Vallitalea longa]|uniref:Cell wall hydrolase SleB domain-containing protein n=1 Tax=Vallitalea longa TaxID=2936439 RepID=A0A9W5YEB1_9FIRM|nr:cell wall hydrolase [Vallitalea longa]GKX31061.1 hypothetical protein SH1V18_35410 [Vallitalea longa]